MCDATVPLSTLYPDPPLVLTCRLNPETGEFEYCYHEDTVDNRGDTLFSGTGNDPFFIDLIPFSEAIIERILHGETNMNVFPVDGAPFFGDNLPCKRTETTGCFTPSQQVAAGVGGIINSQRFQTSVDWTGPDASGQARQYGCELRDLPHVVLVGYAPPMTVASSATHNGGRPWRNVACS